MNRQIVQMIENRSALLVVARAVIAIRRGLFLCGLLAPLLVATMGATPAQASAGPVGTAEVGATGDADSTAPQRTLIIQDVETVGNIRTDRKTIELYFPLRAGDAVDQDDLLRAVEVLRRSELFAEVDFFTRPGSQRGLIVVVLEVREKGLEFRLGTGYHDLSGWYLIPAELALDNRLGRGERIRLQVRFGYRHTGLICEFEEPQFGDGASDWGCHASALNTDRIYFFDGVEYRHRLERGGMGVHLGRRLASIWHIELGASFERVAADSSAAVHTTDDVREVSAGDDLPFEQLPAEVAAAVGERKRTVLRCDLGLDSRSLRQVVGSPAAGLWGRLRLEGYLAGDASFAAVNLDLRGYREALGGVLAGRIRGGGVSQDAAFFDRHYLGGLYTVRGFPSQSLSATEGDTWFWSASCEWRTPLAGARARPRLAGVLFIDAGDSWSRHTRLDATAVSAGYGFRLRVAWFGWLGVDIGVPLTASPADEAFHVHGSIGWTF